MWYVCVVLVCGTCVWHSCVRYLRVVLVHGTCAWCLCVVLVCGTCVWHLCLVRLVFGLVLGLERIPRFDFTFEMCPIRWVPIPGPECPENETVFGSCLGARPISLTREIEK